MGERDVQAPGGQRHGIRPVFNLPMLGQQTEHLVHVEQRLLDLAVHHAEEVERDVELDQQAVHQHQVAERELLRHHALGDQQHQRGHRGGDDQALPDIQQAERSLVLGRGVLVLVQLLVVAARLELLVAEVLHRLVVEQRVDGARVGARVELVGAPADLHAPLGDQHGEHDVDGHGAEGDGGEAPVELGDQHRGHEARIRGSPE